MVRANKASESSEIPEGGGDISHEGEEINEVLKCKSCILERLVLVLENGTHATRRTQTREHYWLPKQSNHTCTCTYKHIVSCCVFHSLPLYFCYLSDSITLSLNLSQINTRSFSVQLQQPDSVQAFFSCCRSQTITSIINHTATSGYVIQPHACI